MKWLWYTCYVTKMWSYKKIVLWSNTDKMNWWGSLYTPLKGNRTVLWKARGGILKKWNTEKSTPIFPSSRCHVSTMFCRCGLLGFSDYPKKKRKIRNYAHAPSFSPAIMGFANIWNSHPKKYGPGSRYWFVSFF